METFISPRPLVSNPDYSFQKERALACVSKGMIDVPIRGVIQALNALPFCFTLQCCYGHFLYDGQGDAESLDPLPVVHTPDSVVYRIAYIAFCVDTCEAGKRLLNILKSLVSIEPNYIQFGSAGWFWGQQVNSYVLQVEPERFKGLDRAVLEYSEALKVETIKRLFFKELELNLHKAANGS